MGVSVGRGVSVGIGVFVRVGTGVSVSAAKRLGISPLHELKAIAAEAAAESSRNLRRVNTLFPSSCLTAKICGSSFGFFSILSNAASSLYRGYFDYTLRFIVFVINFAQSIKINP